MRTSIFSLLWSFTTFAASYDAYFAWQHQAGFETWELNPFVCWLAAVGGLQAVIGFKVVTTVFAMGLGFLCRWRQHWLERPLTLVVASIFLGLSVYYVAAFKTSDADSDREKPPVVSLGDQKMPKDFRPRLNSHLKMRTASVSGSMRQDR
jgi:hypothetical protein